jgi:uncharacterized protein (TIGR02594 family)
MNAPTPPWLIEARKCIGLAEIPGPATAPIIAAWLSKIRAAWCGTAMANWMLAAGIEPPKEPYRALNWMAWGLPLDRGPVVGAVGVLKRHGGGHVTLAVGHDRLGNILGLGGNQRDAVRISAFAPESFVAWRWPLAPLNRWAVAELTLTDTFAASQYYGDSLA